ncbi:protein of unknown function DUF86 [Methanolacinia petrolearia DSM 11571]|uniref:DUF86 domain-containing protein n=1 Tax=Methanolacinia petrolearia (strain DSM 11571 / OCM 486 / SEBR 4847) TaxID=679926 RepID=E1REP5_METP4|nr:DUF86 domain-containing protein [Methanolacinia petrolearia]ADN34992.1 protein of unknown function DUF86 [Methanolacinia petrolearia DSM 11571]
MERNDRIYVLHAVDAAEKALEISGRIQRKDLDSDEIYGLALIRLLEIIGEAANLVSADFQEKYPAIPWKHMISMRNRLIHGYFDINYDIVWDTVKNDLPPLIKSLKQALK